MTPNPYWLLGLLALGLVSPAALALGQFPQPVIAQAQVIADADAALAVALEQLNAGEAAAALALLQEILAQPQPPVTRSQIWAYIAAAQLQLGDLPLANQALRQAQAAFALAAPTDQAAGQRVQGDIQFYLGEAAYYQGDYDQAEESYQTALATATALASATLEADARLGIGAVYHARGALQAALSEFQQALTLAEAEADARRQISALNNIGVAYEALGQYEAALAVYQQGLALATSRSYRRSQAQILGNLGAVYANQGAYDQAQTAYEQALAMYQQTGDRLKQGTALGNLGALYAETGQYDAALASFQQALALALELGDRPGEAVLLNNIGGLYENLGNSSSALDYYQRSLAMRRELGDRAGEARLLNNLGGLASAQGRYADALTHYQQALAIFAETGNRANQGTTLNNLGLLYGELGQPERALMQFEQALELAQALGVPAAEAQALNNIATIHETLADYPAALADYRAALAMRQALGDRAGAGRTLINLGAIESTLGQFDTAEASLNQGLALLQETQTLAGQATALNSLGLIYHQQGQPSQAEAAFRQAIALNQESQDRAGEGTVLGNLGWLYWQNHQLPEAEATLVSAIEILESLRTEDLDDHSQVSLLDRQQYTYDLLQQVLVQQTKLTQALEISERGRGRAIAALFARHLASPTPSTSPTLADLQHLAQTTQSVLVEYALIRQTTQPSLYIWVIQPDGRVDFRSVALSGPTALSTLVTETRRGLGVAGRGGFTLAATEAPATDGLQQLYQLLIAPIADLLPTDPAQTVVVVPQGDLFLVPFAALQTPAGHYLIERHTLAVSPALDLLGQAHTLAQGQPALDLKALAPEDALIVGNPQMPNVWNTATGTQQPLPALPGTQQEATAIAQLLGVSPWLGDRATEAALKPQMATPRLIHLATHGLLDYGNPQALGVQDAPGAIALAPGNGEDGLLTAAEILELDLKADLVVLSACDTGLGNITGDGVIGLSRSLLAAGTPSVMVSLWSVPDAPTAELMTEFYRQLQQGQSRAQALRQAMLKTMQTHPDPKDWAAFTLIGAAGP